MSLRVWCRRLYPDWSSTLHFTTQRLADLRKTYGWNDSFNTERSVLYSHSGLINGNPFVICRTRKMEMGEKTYHGQKTIFWTTTETGPDGKPRTVSHSETLHASVTAPYPNYFERTGLSMVIQLHPTWLSIVSQVGWLERKVRCVISGIGLCWGVKHATLRTVTLRCWRMKSFEVAFNTSNRNNKSAN